MVTQSREVTLKVRSTFKNGTSDFDESDHNEESFVWLIVSTDPDNK